MTRLLRALRQRADDGMTTAEYCVGIVAACSLAFVLYKLITGGLVENLIKGLITRAFHIL
jgi:hypothetical protein